MVDRKITVPVLFFGGIVQSDFHRFTGAKRAKNGAEIGLLQLLSLCNSRSLFLDRHCEIAVEW